jgi:hypothetical protein
VSRKLSPVLGNKGSRAQGLTRYRIVADEIASRLLSHIKPGIELKKSQNVTCLGVGVKGKNQVYSRVISTLVVQESSKAGYGTQTYKRASNRSYKRT